MKKTVVITGANRGLGLALAREHMSRGDTVIGGCRTPSSATELQQLGAQAAALDMASLDSIRSFGQMISGQPIHVLYNSAGVDARAFGSATDQRGPLQIDLEAFHQVMVTNVNGPVSLIQQMAPGLIQAQGTIVNISSQLGSMEVAKTHGPDMAYCVSKAALNMVTVKTAQALASDGVISIAVHPGWLRTDMGGTSADLDPADAARHIADNVAALTIAQSGQFIRWNGTVHPW